MKRFGSYITEKRMTLMYQRMPGARVQTVKGLENPSPREVKALLNQGDGNLRWVATKDRFLAWEAGNALHAQVASAEFQMELMPGGTDLADHHYDEMAQGFIYLNPYSETGAMFMMNVLDDEGRILSRQRTFNALEGAKL